MISKAKEEANFIARRQAVDDFNAANRWKKRGISLVPMRYDHWIRGFGLKMNALVSIFGLDGTISVTHNGIEMGQGMNTKVVQCVAHTFGVPIEMVQIKPVTLVTNPNGSTTGGSAGSETNCVAVIGACNILKARLAPYKTKLGAKATWLEVIWEANKANEDLCAHYMMEVEKDKYFGYQVWGVAVTEVEVDILTGEKRIVRVDLLEDAGLSTSPVVDIGQVEGAFVMGLGLWTRWP
jgi:xanthine dehydrogenase/oxidase